MKLTSGMKERRRGGSVALLVDGRVKFSDPLVIDPLANI